MNSMSPKDIAWVAGLYEGGGSCPVLSDGGVRVEMVSTDEDVMRQFVELVGFGRIRRVPGRKEGYKEVHCWSIRGKNAVEFLECVLPWLGERRGARALEAITWKPRRPTVSPEDTHCVHGHEFTPENTRPRGTGGRICIICRRETQKRYADSHRNEIRQRRKGSQKVAS